MAVLTDPLPFSFTEFSVVSIIFVVIFLLSWGFSLLGNKQVFKFLERLIASVLIIVGTITVYNFSVGMAYHRKEMPLELYQGEIKKDDFLDIATYFVNDYNHCIETLGIDEEGEIKLPYSEQKLIEVLRKQFERLDDEYFLPYTPSAKPMASSGIYTSFGIVGFYFGPLGEANYNTFSTNAELPMYIIHEMCHGKGIMREDDAQLLSLYLLLTSDDELLRYSGYVHSFDQTMLALFKKESENYNFIQNSKSDAINENWNYMYRHWYKKMFMYDFGNTINDWYLKTFGQHSGTSSYDVVPGPIDEQGEVINISKYQSIYFKQYYEKIN